MPNTSNLEVISGPINHTPSGGDYWGHHYLSSFLYYLFLFLVYSFLCRYHYSSSSPPSGSTPYMGAPVLLLPLPTPPTLASPSTSILRGDVRCMFFLTACMPLLEAHGMGRGKGVPAPCPERRDVAELEAVWGTEEDGVLNAAPHRAPPHGQGGDHAVLSGRSRRGVGERDGGALQFRPGSACGQ